MRKVIVCALALMVWSQAVDALECYRCLHGGECFTTTTCDGDDDRCITLIFQGIGSLPPRFAKRCSSQNECDFFNVVSPSTVQAVCCATDRCNR